MIGVFNAKINAFNKAVREGDAQAVCDTGAEMLHIVVDECSKPGVASSVKDVYRKQGKAVLDHIVRLAKSRPAPTGAASTALAVSCVAQRTAVMFPPTSRAISSLSPPRTAPG